MSWLNAGSGHRRCYARPEMTIRLWRAFGRTIFVIAGISGIWLLGQPEVIAQSSISIVSPAPNTVLTAGPDFATDVLGDAWDMNNVEDISKDPEQRRGWTNFGFSNGRVGGTTQYSSATRPAAR